MGYTQHQGRIAAPPETVYNYVADVTNAPHYITAFTEVISGPEPPGPPAEGQRYRVRAYFLGNPALLGLRVARLEPDTLVQLALEGQPSGTLSVQLAPTTDSAATQATITLETPQFNSLMLNFALGGLLEDALQRLNKALRVEE